ncbi:MAG: LacI family DNA-binding transcriptional regulator [Mycobacterium sp.]
MAARRVTIIEIAQHVGLSKTTVSDALHGGGRVSPATAARVADAARELGYVTNRAARQLRGSTVGAFGLYIPAVARSFNFYMEFAFGAAHGSAEHDADLVLFARDPDVGPRHFQVDGVIAVDPLDGDPMLARLADSGIPIISVGRPPEIIASAVIAVIQAPHTAIARDVLDLLHDGGFRKPGFIGSDRQFFSSWADDVRHSYLDWCAAHHVEPLVRDLALTSATTDLQDAVRSLLDAGIDSLVCAPQGFGGRCLPILEQFGIEAGPAFGVASLVGDPSTEFGNVRMTVVDMAPWKFGRDTVNLLAAALAGHADGYLHSFDGTSIRKPDLTHEE